MVTVETTRLRALFIGGIPFREYIVTNKFFIISLFEELQ